MGEKLKLWLGDTDVEHAPDDERTVSYESMEEVVDEAVQQIALKVGDYIECHDKDEMADMSIALGKAGIRTEFIYKMNEEVGLRLRIEEIEG